MQYAKGVPINTASKVTDIFIMKLDAPKLSEAYKRELSILDKAP